MEPEKEVSNEKVDSSEDKKEELLEDNNNKDESLDKVDSANELEKVIPDSDSLQDNSNHSILGLSELEKKDMDTDLLISAVTDSENSKKDLGVESADNSNSNGCSKDLLEKDLSVSDQESQECNGGLSTEFDISKEMVLSIEKSQMNLEESETDLNENFSVERQNEQVTESTDEPMDISETEGAIPSSESQQEDFMPASDTQQEIMSSLSSIGDSSEPVPDKESIDDESRSGLMETEVTQNESEQTVVMMVTDPQDDSQGVELELSDDPSYAGATLFKVPTSDGKQVLLIPFSSTDGGTAVLSLPPGLTLDPENSQSQPIQVALEDATAVDENGDNSEQRYLHVPVEGGVMEELLHTGDDIQNQEKTSVSDLCNHD